MLTALAILGVLAVLFLVTALATSDRQALAPAAPDAPDLALPSGRVGADDVRGLRFGLAARGYRMSEVDAALARLADELQERDRRLAELGGAQSDEAGAAPADRALAAPAVSADAPADETAPVVVPVPEVDPQAAGEAGAAAIDVVDPVPASDAAFGQAEALPLPEGAADAPAPSDGGRPGAISFPMDFPEVQAVEEDVEPADPPLRSS